jgi:hypothetical protein
MNRFVTTLIGALIGALMFAAVGIGMAHAQASARQDGVASAQISAD